MIFYFAETSYICLYNTIKQIVMVFDKTRFWQEVN